MSSPKELAICGSIPISVLECSEPFQLLSKNEKLYAHYISKGSWGGVPIVLEQTSEESPKIFSLFLKLFKNKKYDKIKEESLKSGLTEEEWENFMHYISNFFGNMGNYLSFGDTKFIPNISIEKFKLIIETSENEEIINLFNEISEKIYSLNNNEIALNIPPKGISTYYSSNIQLSDIEFVQKFMQQEKISGYNTRLFKRDNKDYILKLASSIKSDDKIYNFEDTKITIETGDYQEYMESLVSNLQKALSYCANENQSNMIKNYIKHFQYGDINDHKEAQRYWIKDKSPVVETNIGFIESYRDPFGVRGEFESFVSIVDKKASERLVILVDNAEDFLTLLPWGKDFEKDSFSRPDFTSLCVVTFANSGIPAGINIPNYDDIRQSEGFKNVSLGNVLSASASNKPIPFLSSENEQVLKQYKGQAFEIQVALHELLGHGSGKLFRKNEDGTFNFNIDTTTNPLNSEKISSWYNPGETYDSVFKTLGSSMEECRAECVGLYLSVIPKILKLFGVEAEKDNACDITYANWLLLVHAGLRALEFYSPDTNKWRQAHMQARHAIMRVLLENNVVEIISSDDNVTINLKRELLLSKGVPAIGHFLNQIMVYKATADFNSADKLFTRLTSLDDNFLKLRDIVLSKKQPRQVFVQANTEIKGDEVILKSYEPTPKGIIQSFIDRF